VLFDGVLADEKALGDRLVRPAFGHECQHVSLSIGQLFERVVASSPLVYELGDDRRIEHRASGADPPHTRYQLVEVRHPVFEQVTDAVGATGQELDRIRRLDML